MRDLLLGRGARGPRPGRRGGRARAVAGGALGGARDRPRALRHGDRALDGGAVRPRDARAPRRYARPGALPDVRAGDARGGPRAARLHGQRDRGRARRTAARARRRARSRTSTRGVLRVLHDRSLPRRPDAAVCALARYAARLGFARRARHRGARPARPRPRRTGDRPAAAGRRAARSRWASPTRPRRSSAARGPGLAPRSCRARPDPAARRARRSRRADGAPRTCSRSRRPRSTPTPSALSRGSTSSGCTAGERDVVAAAPRPRELGGRARAAARPSRSRRCRGAPARGGRARGRARRRERGPRAGSRSCATCAWRSPATTCSPPASREGPERRPAARARARPHRLDGRAAGRDAELPPRWPRARR